jgi:hypothetical protein
MPYTHKKVGNQYCVYKKDGGEKVGCTDGTEEALKKYMAALHINAKESKQSFGDMIRQEIANILREFESPYEDSFELDQSKGGVDKSQDKTKAQLLKIQKEIHKLEYDMETLFGQYLDGTISKQEYASKRAPLQKKRNELEALIVKV